MTANLNASNNSNIPALLAGALEATLPSSSSDSSTDLKAVLIAFIFQFSITAALVLGFSFLRRHHKSVYQPRLKFASPTKRPPRISDNLFGWTDPIFKFDACTLGKNSLELGPDAVMFLKFVKTLVILFCALSVIGIPLSIFHSNYAAITGQWVANDKLAVSLIPASETSQQPFPIFSNNITATSAISKTVATNSKSKPHTSAAAKHPKPSAFRSAEDGIGRGSSRDDGSKTKSSSKTASNPSPSTVAEAFEVPAAIKALIPEESLDEALLNLENLQNAAEETDDEAPAKGDGDGSDDIIAEESADGVDLNTLADLDDVGHEMAAEIEEKETKASIPDEFMEAIKKTAPKSSLLKIKKPFDRRSHSSSKSKSSKSHSKEIDKKSSKATPATTPNVLDSSLNTLSISQIDVTSSWYWLPAVLTWVISIIVYLLLYVLWRDYISIRKVWFHSKEFAQGFHHRVIMLENVPEKSRNREKILRVLKECLELLPEDQQAEQIVMNRDLKDLSKVVAEHERVVAILEQLLCAHLYDPQNVPFSRPTLLLSDGSVTDAIEFYGNELDELEKKIYTLRAMPDEEHRADWCCFASFRSPKAAERALRMISRRSGKRKGDWSDWAFDDEEYRQVHQDEKEVDLDIIKVANFKHLSPDHILAKLLPGVVVKPCPDLREIQWSTLGFSPTERQARRGLSALGTVLLTVTWTLLAACLGAISDLRVLVGHNPESIAWLDAHSGLQVVWVAFIVPALLSVANLVLPLSLRWLTAGIQGARSESGVERSVMRKLFGLFVYQLFIMALVGSIIASTYTDGPIRIPSFTMGNFTTGGEGILYERRLSSSIAGLASKSNLYMNYLSACLAGYGIEIIQGYSLIMSYLRPWIVRFRRWKGHTDNATGQSTVMTPRELHALRSATIAGPDVDFPQIYGTLAVAFLISLSFSVVSPLILPFAAVFFAIVFVIMKYQFLYVYNVKRETGGSWWPLVFNMSMIGVTFFQVLTLAVIFVANTATGRRVQRIATASLQTENVTAIPFTPIHSIAARAVATATANATQSAISMAVSNSTSQGDTVTGMLSASVSLTMSAVQDAGGFRGQWLLVLPLPFLTLLLWGIAKHYLARMATAEALIDDDSELSCGIGDSHAPDRIGGSGPSSGSATRRNSTGAGTESKLQVPEAHEHAETVTAIWQAKFDDDDDNNIGEDNADGGHEENALVAPGGPSADSTDLIQIDDRRNSKESVKQSSGGDNELVAAAVSNPGPGKEDDEKIDLEDRVLNPVLIKPLQKVWVCRRSQHLLQQFFQPTYASFEDFIQRNPTSTTTSRKELGDELPAVAALASAVAAAHHYRRRLRWQMYVKDPEAFNRLVRRRRQHAATLGLMAGAAAAGGVGTLTRSFGSKYFDVSGLETIIDPIDLDEDEDAEEDAATVRSYSDVELGLGPGSVWGGSKISVKQLTAKGFTTNYEEGFDADEGFAHLGAAEREIGSGSTPLGKARGEVNWCCGCFMGGGCSDLLQEEEHVRACLEEEGAPPEEELLESWMYPSASFK